MNHQHNPIGFGVTLLMLLPALAAAQAPLSIPIKADGSFDLPPRAELIRNEIRTVAATGEGGYGGDGGPATQATLYNPQGMAVDSAGNVFVADIVDHSVRRIDAASRNIETVYETDGYYPWAVAVDEEGNVYVGGGGRIRMIDPSGEVSVIAGTGAKGFAGDGEPAGGAELSVSGIAVDRFGSVWFSDPDGRRIRVLEAWPGQN